MPAASRAALSSLRPRVQAVMGRFSSVDGRTGLAAELYSVASLLTAQPRLRRMLVDPASSPEARAGLADQLFETKVSTSTLQIVKDAAALRWSSPWDFLDALEWAGDDVLLAAAEKEQAADEIEDELFRFERILDSGSSLTTLLDEQTTDVERRVRLLEQVVASKVHPITLALLRHAVTSQRKRSILLAINALIEAAAARRQRSVARVVSAIELSSAQQEHLARALSQLYERHIDVRYAVDPEVRGGLVVRVGDEVIDGSVASRLTQARSAFTG